MSDVHKNLRGDKWNSFSLNEQMANIGAEVGRSINWKKRDLETSNLAAFRALELLSMTIDDPKSLSGVKELTRCYEVLVDLLLGSNEYGSDLNSIQQYFHQFNLAARKMK